MDKAVDRVVRYRVSRKSHYRWNSTQSTSVGSDTDPTDSYSRRDLQRRVRRRHSQPPFSVTILRSLLLQPRW